jgi:hypothetical protein
MVYSMRSRTGRILPPPVHSAPSRKRSWLPSINQAAWLARLADSARIVIQVPGLHLILGLGQSASLISQVPGLLLLQAYL